MSIFGLGFFLTRILQFNHLTDKSVILLSFFKKFPSAIFTASWNESSAESLIGEENIGGELIHLSIRFMCQIIP